MWIGTKLGFYSAAQDRDDQELVHARTWVREDADRLLDWYEGWSDRHTRAHPKHNLPTPAIVTYPGSDYPWRVIMPKDAWADFAWSEAQDVDYDKFKPAVQGDVDRHGAYLDVFFALAKLEFKDPQARETPYMATLGWGDPEPAWDDDYDDRGRLDARDGSAVNYFTNRNR